MRIWNNLENYWKESIFLGGYCGWWDLGEVGWDRGFEDKGGLPLGLPSFTGFRISPGGYIITKILYHHVFAWCE